MSMWQVIRREVAGAWRSLRYDLTRRRSRRRGSGPSTRRRPLRVLALAFATAVAAVGTYAAVFTGLTLLLKNGAATPALAVPTAHPKPAGEQVLPETSLPPVAVSPVVRPRAGTATPEVPQRGQSAPVATARLVPTPPSVPVAPTPDSPTPSAPASSTGTPTPTDSPSDSPTDSPTPTPSQTATSSPSPEESASPSSPPTE
ncbi:MAG TPA: hypothetical protein VIL44_03095 [Micromonospora sp.]